LFPGEKTSKQPKGREHGKSDLKNTSGTQQGYYSLFLEHFPERKHSWRHLSRNKWLAPFSPCAPGLNREVVLY